MKLEDKIKQVIENHQEAYHDAAWESMQSRLDQHFPIQGKKFPWKITGIAAGLITCVAFTAYFWNNSNTTKNNHPTKQVTENIHTVNSRSVNDVQIVEKESVVSNLKKVDGIEINEKINSLKEEKKEVIQYSIPASVSNFRQNDEQKPNQRLIHLPQIADLCSGDKVKIANSNTESVVIKSTSGKEYVIEPNATMNLGQLPEGAYQIGSRQDASSSTFEVKSVPHSDFVDSESHFNEKELPTISLKALSSGVDYEWSVNKQLVRASSKEVDIHFFKKGIYSVTLTTTFANGCKSTETKQIKVQDEYNLLAVTAFEPGSSDKSRATFIPYALTKRDVRFTFVVFDLNGKEVYRTKDANQPWNGVNASTGEEYSSGMFVWQVVLENPEEGEQNSYRGMITIVSK